jgi:hypothetical protein
VNSNEFRAILKGLAQAPESTVNSALAAAKLYHAALSLVSFDPSAAYVSLVCAIECLAGHHYEKRTFDFDSVAKFQTLRPILDKISLLPDACILVDQIKKELINSEHFLLQKFVLFITEHVPQEFYTIPDELNPDGSALPVIAAKHFTWCLKRIYNARSAYVHSGAPFPAYIEFGTRDRTPSNSLHTMLELVGKERYLPLFSWFERLTQMVITEYLRRSFAPEVQQARQLNVAEKERVLGILQTLPQNARDSLERLTLWTARFLGYALINPLAPNKDWADQTATVQMLQDSGLIGSEGDGLQGHSWLKNREVGEIVGEFFFGAEKNPFRDNELLLPKNYEALFSDDDGPAETLDE